MPLFVAVQSEWSPAAYRTEDAFREWLRASVAPARDALSSGEPALVAFPELIGLPLLLTGAPASVRRCRTWLQAGALLAVHNLRTLCAYKLQYRLRWKRALLLMLCRGSVGSIYHAAFSELARDLGATVVAGSAPIEGPDGQVYNVAALFAPDGALLGRQCKVNLTKDEGPSGLDLCAGRMEDVRPFNTPVGRVGVAICLDAFDVDTSRGEPRPIPSVVSRLAEQGAEILVQPSCNLPAWTDDEAAGWREGLHKRMREHASLRYGLNPMMVGHMLDLHPTGQSSILGPGVRDDPPSAYLARATSPRKGETLVVRCEMRDARCEMRDA